VTSVSRSLSYVPVEELEGRPHVIVDGAARSGSVLTLSHWPQSPTPVGLARDLSAEIVFAFLRASRGGDGPGTAQARVGRHSSRLELASAIAGARWAEAVTNDHFDEDGFVSLLAVTDPDFALSHEELLVDVASCGDFGVVRSRQAAQIAFAIGPIGEDAGEAPPAPADRPGSFTGPRYRATLERAVELVEHPDHFRHHWEEQEAALAASQEALRAGAVTIDEVPEVDLAVVRRVAGAPCASGGLDTPLRGGLALHEVALHSATSASRILAFNEGRCELYFRYESWVRYVSRMVPLRPDLEPLAEQLSAAEPSGSRWVADGVGSLVSRMRPVSGVTELAPAVVQRMVVAFLKSAPGAWDPFRNGGALVPVGERRPPR
jgi:hypothetical protein